MRAAEAAARIFWPLGNTKLEKRLPLIEAPTLLLWGEQDRIMPRSYADKFADAITGRTEIRIIPGAGHLAELDKPDESGARDPGMDRSKNPSPSGRGCLDAEPEAGEGAAPEDPHPPIASRWAPPSPRAERGFSGGRHA